MHVTHNRAAGSISLSQKAHVEAILNCFDKSTIRPTSMPSLANEHLIKLLAPEADIKHYQSAVGALMYPALCTQLDMSFTVASLGCHSANPGPDHLCTLDCSF
jgi:hypothetical protein